MQSLKKMLTLLQDLDANELLTHVAARMELKRTRSGHHRLWAGIESGVTADTMAQVQELIKGRGITANAFGKAGKVTAVTFVDDEEDAKA